MGIFNRLTRSKTNKSKSITIQDNRDGVRSSYASTNLVWSKGQTYDNAYPNIKAISNAFLDIIPYAINDKGEEIKNARLTKVLAQPKVGMSGAEFREALAVSALTHRKTYLLVWRSENGKAIAGGRITPENITGFTFIENADIRINKDGSKLYKVGTDSFTDKEVIEITSGIDPYDLSAGYSPSIAIKKWANVDDYIVDYQAGFFENGAVPSGQFVITAGSVEQFNEIVDMMQERHRSSGNNNNVQYIHRPVASDGSPVSAQIEWIPFSQPNSQLGLKDIFEETNKKLDSAFGVPSSIRGVNDHNTYASVKVDEKIFIKYTVKPFATKIWTKFISELNRITGGLGYGLTFDVEVPNLADEEKVESEKKKVDLDIITQALASGFDLDDIITAFELPEAYKELKIAQKPQIPESVSPKVCSHDHCSCGCGEVSKSLDPKGVKLEKKIRDVLDSFTDEKIKKTISDNFGISKAVEEDWTEEEIQEYLTQLSEMEVQPATTETKSKYASVISIAVLGYILNRGKTQYTNGLRLVENAVNSGELKVANSLLDDNGKLATDRLSGYAVTNQTTQAYMQRLATILDSYDNQITTAIRGQLANIYNEVSATGRPMRRDVIIERIKQVSDLDEWRAERIARTEENYARQLSQIDAMIDIKNKINIKILKKWICLGSNPCEFCQSMNGSVEELEKPFVPLMATIQGVDGGIMFNNYAPMESANAHPNCNCKIDFILEGE